MISGAISDVQITSSSQLDEDHSSTRARLHLKAFDNKSSGWSPVKSDRNQWLQVDLDGSARITRLATQGSNAKDEWVTKYMLEYSYDGVRFHTYRESVEETSAKVSPLALLTCIHGFMVLGIMPPHIEQDKT